MGEPCLFGGQGRDSVRLCADCAHRPPRWAHSQGGWSRPCGLRPDLDAIDARDACKGDDWKARPSPA